jgi:hypothetical protein
MKSRNFIIGLLFGTLQAVQVNGIFELSQKRIINEEVQKR